MEQPTSLAEIVSLVLASMHDPNRVDRELLHDKIVNPLTQAYQAKLVKGERETTTGAARAREVNEPGVFV